MKKLFKKVISAVLSLAIIITCLPLATTDVEAATNGVQERINQLLNVYPNGSYFTKNGQSCVDSGFFDQHVYITGVRCPNCNLADIPARGGFPAGSAVGWGADTCAGFAGYVYYNIFGHNHLTQTTVYSNASTASTGDIVDTGSHWFVYLWQDDSYYYGYDANSHSRGQISDKVWICDQMVQYNRAFPKSSYPLKTVYHANNYGQINGSTNMEYTPITPATYFIVSKSDGKALTLGNNEDWNTNNIHMYETTWTNRGQYMVITEAPDGYKIRPIDSTRLVNPYGDYAASGENINIYADVNDNSQWWKFQKVDGGYVIRNTQNPNLVIDNSQSDNAVLWEYNGGANQIWELIPVSAPGKPVITNVKSSYETSESVVVKWGSTSNTNQYNIAVEKKTNGEYKEIYWKDNVSSGYTLNSVMTLDPGDYRVRVASVNNKVLNGDYYLSTIGDYVNFTVKEKTAASYTIKFNANGGSGTMSDVVMTVGKSQNLPKNTFTRSGYTFLGWSKDKNASAAAYTDGQSVKDLAQSGTVTLYAIWKKNTSSNVNGSLRVDDVTVSVGQTVQIPIYIDEVELSGLVFTVNFDPAVLKYVSAADMAFEAADYNTSNISKGSLSISCVNMTNAVSGKIVTLSFEVIAGSACTTKVSVSASDAIDAKDKEVVLKSSEATVTVSATKKGDVTGDGKITVADAKWVLQAASGARTLTEAQKASADVNSDGKVSVTDAKWILQIVSGSRKLT